MHGAGPCGEGAGIHGAPDRHARRVVASPGEHGDVVSGSAPVASHLRDETGTTLNAGDFFRNKPGNVRASPRRSFTAGVDWRADVGYHPAITDRQSSDSSNRPDIQSRRTTPAASSAGWTVHKNHNREPTMKKQIARLSPHQNGKVFGVLFAVSSLLFLVPILLLMMTMFPAVDQQGNPIDKPYFMLAVFPVFYLVMGYLSVVAVSAVYNVLFRYVGGFEYEAEDKGI